MSKINLEEAQSGFQDTTVTNNNFALIEAEFQDRVLYRDNVGTEPNQMENVLDMNQNRLLNLPAPINNTEPVRWVDIKDGVSTIVEPLPSQVGNAGKVISTTGSLLTFRQAPHVVDDYVDIRGYISSIIQDDDIFEVTTQGHAGMFVVKTGTVTDNDGTLIVFDDDSNRYAERHYDGPVWINWFTTLAQSQPNGSDTTDIIQAIVDEFSNITGLGIFTTLGTITLPTNRIFSSPDGSVPGYGLIDAHGVLGSDYGLTLHRANGAGFSNEPLLVITDSNTVKCGVRSLMNTANGGMPFGIVKLGNGVDSIRQTKVDVDIVGNPYILGTGETVRSYGDANSITGFAFDTSDGDGGAGANTVSIYESDIRVSVKSADIALRLDNQCNANQIHIRTKDCSRHIWLDGGVGECLENIFFFNLTQGVTYTTSPFVITMRNLCRFNQFFGISEIFGSAFDITGSAASAGFNQIIGQFNELFATDVGETNTLLLGSSRDLFGTTFIKHNSAVTALNVDSLNNTITGDHGEVANVTTTDAFGAGIGGGIGFGGEYGPGTTTFSYVKGQKANAASGDFGGGLTAGVRVSGGSFHDVWTIKANRDMLWQSKVSVDSTNPGFHWIYNATAPFLRVGSTGTGGETKIAFSNGNGDVGSITTNGTATAYNVSSDYRLKENILDLEDASTRLSTIRPVRFNFKTSPDTTLDGFIAHELSEAVPEAVTFEKDGENFQQVDYSKVIPLLVASLQEALGRIEVLEAAQ